MARGPCCLGCEMGQVKKGSWREEEDRILIDYIQAHGVGRWVSLPKRAGLNRCSKSCRLRWLNYLRPDVKRGNISPEEDDLILRLHRLLGNRLSNFSSCIFLSHAFRPVSAYNIIVHFSAEISINDHYGCRWSLIAGRLPGRTDNEIKNYWNTTLGKKAQKDRSKQLNILEDRRCSDLPKNNMNTKLQVDDTTGIQRNPLQSSSCFENEASVSPAAFWARILKCTETDMNAQISIQHDEHDNYRFGIKNGEPFGGDTTTTFNNIEGARENAAKDPVMNFDFGDDIFLSDLLNSEILVGSNPSSLPTLADLMNSDVLVASNPSSVPWLD
ncbi:hypothetical protein SAY87_026038 [Trapa incisa]|uniref:Uncharacterized protein n=1 Tax=Trapa incisa TaxID=236973 RepID=A0AAN7GMG4_9MYRT|nr:hypothetical protein SAY87_026038 [Trapa incisa]